MAAVVPPPFVVRLEEFEDDGAVDNESSGSIFGAARTGDETALDHAEYLKFIYQSRTVTFRYSVIGPHANVDIP